MGFEVWYKVKEKLELILYPNQYSRDHKDSVSNTKWGAWKNRKCKKTIKSMRYLRPLEGFLLLCQSHLVYCLLILALIFC